MVMKWRNVIKKDHRSKRSNYLRIKRSHTSNNNNRQCKHAMCKSITVNRSCLTRSEHMEMLSTPRGQTWTGTRGLGFIVDRCKKKYTHDHNHRYRLSKPTKPNAVSCCHDSDMEWQNFAKQFLEIAKDNLAPVTKMILTKILTSRVNSSDQTCCNYTNAKTELCRFLRNITPKCDSKKWKRDFFKTLSSLIFNYIVHVHCSRRLSKKTKMTNAILKVIKNITLEDVLLESPENFSQGVQIFIANILSPWLEKPITNICNTTNNNFSHIESKKMNEFQKYNKFNIDSTGKNKQSKNRKLIFPSRKLNIDNTNQNIFNKGNNVHENGKTNNIGMNIKNKHSKVKELLIGKYKKSKGNKNTTKQRKIIPKKNKTEKKSKDIFSKKSYEMNKKMQTNGRRKKSMIKTSIVEKFKKSLNKTNKTGKDIKTESVTTTIKDSKDKIYKSDKITSNSKLNDKKAIRQKLKRELLKRSKLKIRGSKSNKKTSRTKFGITNTKYDKSNDKNNKMNDLYKTVETKSVNDNINKNLNISNINENKQSPNTELNQSMKNNEYIQKKLTKLNSSNDDITTKKNIGPNDNQPINGIDQKNNITGIDNVDLNENLNNITIEREKIQELERLKNKINTLSQDKLSVGNIRHNETTMTGNKNTLKINDFNETKSDRNNINYKSNTSNFIKRGQSDYNREINQLTKNNDDNGNDLNLLNEKELSNIFYDEENDRTNYKASLDNSIELMNEDELECLIMNEINRFLNKLEEYCIAESIVIVNKETVNYYDNNQLHCKHEGNCFERFAINTKRWFTVKRFKKTETKYIEAKCSNEDNENPGVIYQIFKRDGSNYSIHKTILPNNN